MQNMNVELVAQMFRNYQSNVLFHLEGMRTCTSSWTATMLTGCSNGRLGDPSTTATVRS